MRNELWINDWANYNNGGLGYGWMTPEQVIDFIDESQENGEDREWFIADYELPFEVGELTPIYDLCEALLEFEELDDFEQACVAALVDVSNSNLAEAIESLDRYTFYEDLESYHDCCDELLDFSGNSWLERYFDYEAYHRDCDFDVTEASNGIVVCLY